MERSIDKYYKKTAQWDVILMEWRYTESPYKYTLGLEYIASYLKSVGISARNFVFEADFLDKTVKKILSYNPKLIGIHFYREAEPSIFALARKLKKLDKNIIIAVGGHTATLFAAAILEKEPCIDIVSFGEGEKTFEELWYRIKHHKSFKDCKGIFYRETDYIMKNPPRELIENLDDLPYPALDVLKESTLNSTAVFAAISTSRGCMGNCRFCISNRIYDNTYKKMWRGRSPENVIGEILRLRDTFAHKRLSYRIVDGSIEDQDFKTKNRLERLICLYEENEIHIPFEVLTRADSWTEKDIPLIKRMKNVGLYAVDIGFEASTDKSLKVFNKKAHVEDNFRTYQIFTDNGIDVFGFIIMFHPYTSFDELEENARFLMDVDMAYQPQSWWSELYLWPDSKILTDIVKDGLLLGFEEKGYQLKYGFVDGQTQVAYDFLRDISKLESVQAYWDTIEKVKIECLLYNVWKRDDKQLLEIAEEMGQYEKWYRKCRKDSGKEQYDLFMKLLKVIREGQLEKYRQDLLNNWEDTMKKWQKKLEQQWLIIKLKQGRKKIKLL